jgi:hypothetical protein
MQSLSARMQWHWERSAAAMKALQPPRNGKPRPLTGPIATANAAQNALPVPQTGSAFSASTVELARRMRFNPLRMVTPENLAAAHDHFDLGYLWQGALFWDAMIRRDDTLSFVVPQLQNAIAAKPWGVQKRKDADPIEAARHAAALQYFYDNVSAVDAFDKNIRGDRHLLLKQMGMAHATRYAVHHFVWKPSGKMIEVEGGAPVPALTAEMEYVPLWFFENTSGTLRLLRHGGYGGIGEDLDWQGEWMVTSGEGAMFAAAGCYIFKRLTFQDWTIYNERYGQQKVIGMTNARADSDAGRALTRIVQDFNGDMGIALHECQATDKPPISLLGPEGTANVEVFERFLDRQDGKMTVMFRGGAQANVASKDNEHGITAQINETEALEIAHCQNIASACRTFIDRAVIRFCFGEDVEPLAWFGLPDMDTEDAQQLRDSAGFIADRGGRVDLPNVADRLGVPMVDENADEEDVLQPVVKGAANGTQDEPPANEPRTANTARLSRLQQLVEDALRTGNADAAGHWVTINHEHVFIKDGDHRSAQEIVSHRDDSQDHEALRTTLKEHNARGAKFQLRESPKPEHGSHMLVGKDTRGRDTKIIGSPKFIHDTIAKHAGHPAPPAQPEPTWNEEAKGKSRAALAATKVANKSGTFEDHKAAMIAHGDASKELAKAALEPEAVHHAKLEDEHASKPRDADGKWTDTSEAVATPGTISAASQSEFREKWDFDDSEISQLAQQGRSSPLWKRYELDSEDTPAARELRALHPKQKLSREHQQWQKGSKLTGVVYHGSDSEFEQFRDGWNFVSPDESYAQNFAHSSKPTPVYASIKKPLDLRQFSGTADVNPAEVLEALRKSGIEVPADKFGKGEIHQVLMPVRNAIREQAVMKGFDGIVQNENFNGRETESWAAFHGSQLRKVK